MDEITVKFRFHGNLKIFLPKNRCAKGLSSQVKGTPSLKDAIESLNIPHTKIDVLRVNKKPAGFSYWLREEETIGGFGGQLT
jgi:hypothetical protein